MNEAEVDEEEKDSIENQNIEEHSFGPAQSQEP